MKAFTCDECRGSATHAWYGSEPHAVIEMTYRSSKVHLCSRKCAETWMEKQEAPDAPPTTGVKWLTEMSPGWNGAPAVLKLWPGCSEADIEKAFEGVRKMLREH